MPGGRSGRLRPGGAARGTGGAGAATAAGTGTGVYKERSTALTTKSGAWWQRPLSILPSSASLESLSVGFLADSLYRSRQCSPQAKTMAAALLQRAKRPLFFDLIFSKLKRLLRLSEIERIRLL